MNRVELVRRQIDHLFRRLGARPDGPPTETILIRNGYYCGRRFETDGLRAVWFVEEDEIKVYGAGGAVLLVCRPEAEPDDGPADRQQVA